MNTITLRYSSKSAYLDPNGQLICAKLCPFKKGDRLSGSIVDGHGMTHDIPDTGAFIGHIDRVEIAGQWTVKATAYVIENFSPCPVDTTGPSAVEPVLSGRGESTNETGIRILGGKKDICTKKSLFIRL